MSHFNFGLSIIFPFTQIFQIFVVFGFKNINSFRGSFFAPCLIFYHFLLMKYLSILVMAFFQSLFLVDFGEVSPCLINVFVLFHYFNILLVPILKFIYNLIRRFFNWFCLFSYVIIESYDIYWAIVTIIVWKSCFDFYLSSVLWQKCDVNKIIFIEIFLKICLWKCENSLFYCLVCVMISKFFNYRFIFWILIAKSSACLYNQYWILLLFFLLT